MYILAFFFMFIKADIDKDNVTSDRFDTSERYDIHKFTSKEAAKPSRARNNYRIDTAIFRVKVNINNTAYNTAVLFVDNLLVF